MKVVICVFLATIIFVSCASRDNNVELQIMMLERRIAALETKDSNGTNTLEKRINNLERKMRQRTKPRSASINEYKKNYVKARTIPLHKKYYLEPAILWHKYSIDNIIDVGAKQAVQGYFLAGTSEISGHDQKTAQLKKFAKELGVAIVNVYSFTRHGTRYHSALFMYKDNDGVPKHERERVEREMRDYVRENLDKFVPGKSR